MPKGIAASIGKVFRIANTKRTINTCMSAPQSSKDKEESPVSLRVMSSVPIVDKKPLPESVRGNRELEVKTQTRTPDEKNPDTRHKDSALRNKSSAAKSNSTESKGKSTQSKSNSTESKSKSTQSKGKSTEPRKKSKSRLSTKTTKSSDYIDLSRGSRGVDTLLRNAYRSQLDMQALAATKANIMISLNGLLMSMLIISGTHLVAINGLYVIPIVIFLITCATATTFAVFAARPETSRNHYELGDFERDEARLMVFEEFSDLSESEYVDAMTTLLSNPQRTYKSMLSHIHELGTTADKKYQHLYYSYTAFMAGTILTVVSLLMLVIMRWAGFMTLA